LKAIVRSSFFVEIIARLIVFFARLLFISTKVVVENFEHIAKFQNTDKGYIALFWHGRSMLSPFFVHETKKQVFGLFSNHPDGRLMARIFALNRVGIIWGSTTSSTPSTIRNSISALKTGGVLAFSPDGPIGPRFTIATSSSLYFAAKTGVPIIPFYISAKNAKMLSNWDRYMIVKPFSKMGVKIGQPFYVSEKDFKENLDVVKKKLQDTMVLEQQELDARYGLPHIEPETFEESRVYKKLKRAGKI
jgi:lysophospholipid acyltransferase (LPLAT)-like uncharacterized protein